MDMQRELTSEVPESAIDGIPTSWLGSDGIRHITIFDESLPHQYRRLEKIDGRWELVEEPPF